jgi:uncharacterized protein YbjT (DUF2867 family)
MNVVLFGASGMVGQGVLRECLLDGDVGGVLAVGRSPVGWSHDKLREIVRANVADLGPVEDAFRGLDACFFCLGVSSAGMKEADYRRVTFDLTLEVARTLARLNPGMTFIYVSGAGTDSTGRGRIMWARVKGETENALLRLPFKAAYMFRPGVIQPLHGITSKTRLYRVLYGAAGPLITLARILNPRWVTTTERVGRAMIRVGMKGAPKALLENRDIKELAG